MKEISQWTEHRHEIIAMRLSNSTELPIIYVIQNYDLKREKNEREGENEHNRMMKIILLIEGELSIRPHYSY